MSLEPQFSPQRPHIVIDPYSGFWKVWNPMRDDGTGQKVAQCPLKPGCVDVRIAPWNWFRWHQAHVWCRQRNLEEGRYLP